MKKSILFCALALSAGAAWACELCETRVHSSFWAAPNRSSAAVSGQYSKYDRSSGGEGGFEGYNTQVAAAYRIVDRLALQFNVPYLDRELDEDTESGLGDVAALVVFRAFLHESGDHATSLDLYAGVKAPTGNTDPLKEEREIAESGHEENHHAEEEHHDQESHGVHSEGHHLALGSGSWDGIFGLIGRAKRGHWQAGTEVQYVACTEGDYDFEYGDEFFVRAGVRYHLWVESQRGCAVGADVSREWQDENEVGGKATGEGASTASYIGPVLEFSWSENWTASAAADIAIEGRDNGLSGAADRRLRASVGCVF